MVETTGFGDEELMLRAFLCTLGEVSKGFHASGKGKAWQHLPCLKEM